VCCVTVADAAVVEVEIGFEVSLDVEIDVEAVELKVGFDVVDFAVEFEVGLEVAVELDGVVLCELDDFSLYSLLDGYVFGNCFVVGSKSSS
jgi:methenyltetrahydromethanopterin cyclohydrolase